MTLQDDRARPWFQPLVPHEQPHSDFTNDAGPLTTRIEGELVPPDQPLNPAPWTERLEVTQPFIPAIREQAPEFAKRLNPEPTPPTQAAEEPGETEPAPPPGTASPASQQRPVEAPSPDTAAASGDGSSETVGPPQKRRSLARRVVRRILGPDLLRKDPPPRKR